MHPIMQRTSAYVLGFVVLLLPLVALGEDPAARFRNPIAVNSLTELLVAILDAVILILFPFIVLFIVYGGFKLVSANGDPGQIKEGKQAITYAIIGALVILSAQALALAIKGTVEDIRGEPFTTF